MVRKNSGPGLSSLIASETSASSGERSTRRVDAGKRSNARFRSASKPMRAVRAPLAGSIKTFGLFVEPHRGRTKSRRVARCCGSPSFLRGGDQRTRAGRPNSGVQKPTWRSHQGRTSTVFRKPSALWVRGTPPQRDCLNEVVAQRDRLGRVPRSAARLSSGPLCALRESASWRPPPRSLSLPGPLTEPEPSSGGTIGDRHA